MPDHEYFRILRPVLICAVANLFRVNRDVFTFTEFGSDVVVRFITDTSPYDQDKPIINIINTGDEVVVDLETTLADESPAYTGDLQAVNFIAPRHVDLEKGSCIARGSSLAADCNLSLSPADSSPRPSRSDSGESAQVAVAGTDYDPGPALQVLSQGADRRLQDLHGSRYGTARPSVIDVDMPASPVSSVSEDSAPFFVLTKGAGGSEAVDNLLFTWVSPTAERSQLSLDIFHGDVQSQQSQSRGTGSSRSPDIRGDRSFLNTAPIEVHEDGVHFHQHLNLYRGGSTLRDIPPQQARLDGAQPHAESDSE